MLFSKKKKAAGSKAQQISPQTDVGMAVIQEFLNRGPGAMKARSGPSTAHILSENDGAVVDASTLISMRLTASAKRFRGCGHNWSDGIRQQFNAQQQLLLTRAEKKQLILPARRVLCGGQAARASAVECGGRRRRHGDARSADVFPHGRRLAASWRRALCFVCLGYSRGAKGDHPGSNLRRIGGEICVGKNTIAGSSRGGQSSHRQRGTHVCRVLPICFTMLNSRSRIRPRPASPRSPCRDCSTSGTAHDRPPHAPFACKLFWRLFILISFFFCV